MDDVFKDFENATIFGIEVNTCDIDYEYFESLSIDLNEEEEDDEEIVSSESSDEIHDHTKKNDTDNNNDDNKINNNTVTNSWVGKKISGKTGVEDLKPEILSLGKSEEINFCSTIETNNNRNFICTTKSLDFPSSSYHVEDVPLKKNASQELNFSECLALNKNKKLISTTSTNSNFNVIKSDFRKVTIQLNSSPQLNTSLQNAQHQVALYTNNINDLCQYYKIRENTANSFHTTSGIKIVTTELPTACTSHDETRRFECDICGKRFQKKCNLIAHKRTHTGERPFKCDICDKAFSESSSVFKHQRVHTGERPYKCEICDRVFKQICNLKKHRNKHNNSRVFRCNICDKCFVRNNHLIQHQIVHSTQHSTAN